MLYLSFFPVDLGICTKLVYLTHIMLRQSSLSGNLTFALHISSHTAHHLALRVCFTFHVLHLVGLAKLVKMQPGWIQGVIKASNGTDGVVITSDKQHDDSLHQVIQILVRVEVRLPGIDEDLD
jgi:hypothetical protein